ncbi:MAG: bifunctional oligoribonuclease/PAP phosphatase NrnA [Deltaproteobacteria bacterium]|nr:bifunctional oligoribonuclease/PAP phosphatase NrnA [Deltaproteobacteria bacterium]
MHRENISNHDRLEKLFEIVRRKREILILTHNNPDPDALASALTLKYIFRTLCNVESVIAYGGVVGRAENKAMIKNLKITIHPLTDITIKNFSVIALVDTQPGSGNNSLPKSILPSIIIDHHRPVRAKSRKSPFVDIRTDYGSTSTILAEYLKESNIHGIDRNVATALLYGIKSDTRDLGRGTNPQDLEAFLYLYPRVNFKVLSRIEHPALSREHFKTFEKAIKNAMIYKDVVVSDVDRIDNPDSLAEMADLLVRLEGINWSLCLGTFQDDIYFSVRTTKTRERADRIVQNMVRKIGSAGGHTMIAAGKVDHSFIHRNDHAATINTLISRFLKGIKREAFQGKNL